MALERYHQPHHKDHAEPKIRVKRELVAETSPTDVARGSSYEDFLMPHDRQLRFLDQPLQTARVAKRTIY